jgi:c-di-GMP-binding flagellar brake protein YcgR
MADAEPRWGVASLQRRQQPRLNVSLPVEFVVRRDAPAPGPDAEARPIELRNVSGGGLLLVLPGPQPAGARLGLTLFLPDGPVPLGESPARGAPRPIRAETVVVWTDLATEGAADECRCGVTFTSIANADRRAILEFIGRGRTD